ncbi:uncharacterized protein SCHCODRAFT_01211798 [Schizophyllum commune H4-8]|nr:uncharacterized protein SCHCODRAFT_01211798 [Schizophyllum commune H4-8]KAI5895696.1 hypothetical protein SCHCODRAFT_01211798 [Schizophyllum commune H4-8]
MSTDMADASYYASELLRLVRVIEDARYGMVAAYSLGVYEWLLSLDEEILLIIRAPWTAMKFAYLFCRYYYLIYWPLMLWAFVGNHNYSLCLGLTRPVNALLMPMQFISQGIMAMRAYAFTGRNKRIAILLVTCYTLLVGVDIWTFTIHILLPPQELYTLLGGTGCFPNYGDKSLAFRYGICMLAAVLMDLVSLISMLSYHRHFDNSPGSLSRVFISQGLFVFACVALMNAVGAIIYFNPITHYSGIFLPVVVITSNVLACRIILHLRRKAYPTSSELMRQHSILVREDLRTRDESQPPPTPLHYQRSSPDPWTHR